MHQVPGFCELSSLQGYTLVMQLFFLFLEVTSRKLTGTPSWWTTILWSRRGVVPSPQKKPCHTPERDTHCDWRTGRAQTVQAYRLAPSREPPAQHILSTTRVRDLNAHAPKVSNTHRTAVCGMGERSSNGRDTKQLNNSLY